MTQQNKINAFLDNLSPECPKCSNLTSTNCPVFNAAVLNGADPVELKQAIEDLQKGKDLNTCSKTPSGPK